jgi:hypothetical protein
MWWGDTQRDLNFGGNLEVTLDENRQATIKETDEAFYLNRPPELERMCAYELFARHSGKKYLLRTKMLTPIVKPYRPIDLTWEPDDPRLSRYCEQRLRIFKPWRCDEDLLGESANDGDAPNWIAAYDSWMASGKAPLLEQRKYQRAADAAEEEFEKRLADAEAGAREKDEEDDWAGAVGGHDAPDADWSEDWERRHSDGLFGGDAVEQAAPVQGNSPHLSCEELAGTFGDAQGAGGWLDNLIGDSDPLQTSVNLLNLDRVHLDQLEGDQLLAVQIVKEHLMARKASEGKPTEDETGTHPMVTRASNAVSCRLTLPFDSHVDFSDAALDSDGD